MLGSFFSRINNVFFVRRGVRSALSYRVGNASLIAMLVGLVFVALSYMMVHPFSYWWEAAHLRELGQEILREFGVVLVSVFGISYWYEKFSAERQFRKFEDSLTEIMGKAETNAAMCQRLGIMEIYSDRLTYEARHSISMKVKGLTQGDTVRVFGRSLMYLCDNWEPVHELFQNGMNVELCMFDPTISETPLSYLSGYMQEDAQWALKRFRKGLKHWLALQTKTPSTQKQRIVVKAHSIHLMDSLIETIHGDEHWAAWDINFGPGKVDRNIFVLDGAVELGKNLTQDRYEAIWKNAVEIFHYEDGKIKPNHFLEDVDTPTELGTHLTPSNGVPGGWADGVG